jgi:UDP-N-acetylmuramate dehydrogenase
VGNAGSFFKNPVLASSEARTLQGAHPGLPAWPAGDGKIKFSAARMIEDCGLKGCAEGPAEVSRLHALVLVNRGGATGQEIWRLARRVQDEVQTRFGIHLEPEPRIFEFSHKV